MVKKYSYIGLCYVEVGYVTFLEGGAHFIQQIHPGTYAPNAPMDADAWNNILST